MSEAIHLLMPLDATISEAMGAAFEAAWASLCASRGSLSAQQACNARIHLARAILDQVHRGERDPARLSKLALASLTVSKSNLAL
jgi:hypothetical protein